MDRGGCYTVATMRRISPDEAEYRQRLGDLIRRARERKGWSQTELATQLGVTRATVANYEDGSSEPGTYRIAALREHLGIKLESFERPPAKRLTIAEPLSDYLVDEAMAAVEAEAAEPDRRRRDRRAR